MLPFNMTSGIITAATLMDGCKKYQGVLDFIASSGEIEKAGFVLLFCMLIASIVLTYRDLHSLLGLKGWIVVVSLCAVTISGMVLFRQLPPETRHAFDDLLSFERQMWSDKRLQFEQILPDPKCKNIEYAVNFEQIDRGHSGRRERHA